MPVETVVLAFYYSAFLLGLYKLSQPSR